MKADGTFLAEWDLAGNDQEEVTLIGDKLFVAEDVGKEVWRYAPFSILLRPRPADYDDNGQVALGDLKLVLANWGPVQLACRRVSPRD
jgi:hypothetical protein